MGRVELAGKSWRAWKQAALSWFLRATSTEIQQGHYWHYSDQGDWEKREKNKNKRVGFPQHSENVEHQPFLILSAGW